MKIAKLATTIALVFIALAVFGVLFMINGMDNIKNMTIDNVNISAQPDGVYTGAIKGSRWANTVEVTVASGKISDIKVIKDQVFHLPNVTTGIIKSVEDKQSLQVDIVSGATVSSKAYLKAIENALTGK